MTEASAPQAPEPRADILEVFEALGIASEEERNQVLLKGLPAANPPEESKTELQLGLDHKAAVSSSPVE